MNTTPWILLGIIVGLQGATWLLRLVEFTPLTAGVTILYLLLLDLVLILYDLRS